MAFSSTFDELINEIIRHVITGCFFFLSLMADEVDVLYHKRTDTYCIVDFALGGLDYFSV